MVEVASPWSDIAAETLLPSIVAVRDPGDSVHVVAELPNVAPLVAARPTRSGSFSFGPQFIESHPIIGGSASGDYVFAVTRLPSLDRSSGTFQVRLWRPDGSSLGGWEVGYIPQAAGQVARDTLRHALERWFATTTGAGEMFDLESSVAAYWIPEWLPPVTAVSADSEGLWIAREGFHATRRWERYGLDGRLRAVLELDRQTTVLASTDSSLVVRSDALSGEPRIGLLTLRRQGGSE